VKGSDFEAVDSSSLMIDPDSGQARTAPPPADRTPPRSVTGLSNTTYLPDSVTWRWTDPSDADLARVMVYLDGTWKANVTKGTCSFSATGLSPATAYTVATRTVDTSGNANASLVNHTARTASAAPADRTPPRSVTGLSNTTYLPDSVTWRWNDPADPDFARVMVYIDGTWKANVTKGTCSFSATGLSPSTSHTLGTRTVDTTGNINASFVNHTARTAPAVLSPPTISFLTPDSGRHGTTVFIRNLAGTGFQKGARIELAKSGLPTITAKSVKVVSSSKITCTFSLPSRANAGYRDVVVTNPDGGTFTLRNGFRVR
jgi:hypothetical protein